MEIFCACRRKDCIFSPLEYATITRRNINCSNVKFESYSSNRMLLASGNGLIKTIRAHRQGVKLQSCRRLITFRCPVENGY